MTDNLISIDDFAKIDIRVGTIVNCETIEGSNKLLKETVDFGEKIGTKIILSGIRKWYNPESLVGKQAIFIINLPPRKMMGTYDSEGMIMVAEHEEKLTILKPSKKMPNGSRIL
jgi:methionine--tRNA ligase beta chain